MGAPASSPFSGPVGGLSPISPEPRVQLINTFQDPFNNAVATARTCYSPTVVLPEAVNKDEKSRAQRDAIAETTYKAGHHTTLQHSNFQFTLENVSRQFIWSFLHSHPFYNSEQAVRNGEQWTFAATENPASVQHITALFDALGKQIRQGWFELPLAQTGACQ